MNIKLTDGRATILLAETEREVIPQSLTPGEPIYSRNPAWNRLNASSWIFAVPYLNGQDFEGNFLYDSESQDCR